MIIFVRVTFVLRIDRYFSHFVCPTDDDIFLSSKTVYPYFTPRPSRFATSEKKHNSEKFTINKKIVLL